MVRQHIMFSKPAWTEILGHEIAELAGNSFASFVHPDNLPMCADYFQIVLTTDKKQDAIEYWLKKQFKSC
jgi:hypothetical protein